MNTDYVRTLTLESEAFLTTLEAEPVLGKIINGKPSREDYVRYLIASYHYVRWSGFLLAKTAQGLRSSGPLSRFTRPTRREGPGGRAA